MSDIRRLVGYVDMLRINGGALARALHHLGMMSGGETALIVAFGGDWQDQPVDANAAASAVEHLDNLRVECLVLDVPVTVVAVERMKRLLESGKCTRDSFKIMVEQIETRLFDEVSLRHVFVIGPKHAALYDGGGFSPEVIDQFPGAAYDIDEAAKCLAFGRPTASVFHLMRVMEAALRAIHACLGLGDTFVAGDRNWGAIASRIRENIKQRGAAFDERDLFLEIYALLDAVKDAWRNSTMHVDDKKTEEEAEAILVAVRGFMKKIAARMDENGLPKA